MKEYAKNITRLEDSINGFNRAIIRGKFKLTDVYLVDILNQSETIFTKEPDFIKDLSTNVSYTLKDKDGYCINFDFEIYKSYQNHIATLNNLLSTSCINAVKKQTKFRL